MLFKELLSFLSKVLQCANKLCSVGHFVVIPSHSFNQLLVANCKNFSLCSIEQGTESDSFDIGRYDFIFSISVSFWIGSSFHGCVDFISSYLFLKNSYQLSQ